MKTGRIYINIIVFRGSQYSFAKIFVFPLILIFALSSCGGPEEPDGAEGVINLNLSVNARTARALPDSATLAQLSYFVTLQGNVNINSGPTALGTQNVSIKAPAGHYTVMVTAYLNNKIYAEGSSPADIQPGKTTSVTVKMHVIGGADITSWTAVANSPFGDTGDIKAIAYGNGKFVAVGYEIDHSSSPALIISKIAYSTNGINWITANNNPFNNDNILAITYGSGKFVAVGENGKIAYSENGIHWTAVTIMSPSNQYDNVTINAIAYGGGKFVAVGSSCIMAFSEDGRSWTPVNVNYTFNTIAYGDGKFVAGGGVDNDKIIAYLSNDSSWHNVNQDIFSGHNDSINTIVYGGDKFIAGGEDSSGGKMAYSLNGQTWTGVSNSIFNNINSIVYGDGKFVAVGNNGKMAYSEDDINWIAITTITDIFIDTIDPTGPTLSDIYVIAYGGGKFVAGGTNGKIAYTN